MEKTWLLIDVPYLCYRSFHALAHLPAADIGTEVIYGFFKTIVNLQDRHDTPHIVFCFDRGTSLRELIYPKYKSSRKKQYEAENTEQTRKRKRLRRQIRALRTQLLRDIGFRNIFSQPGYEADDIIASICEKSLKDDKAIIVTSDHDFYQLITPQVSIWDPGKQKKFTFSGFRKKYELDPAQWHMVKAIAGCSSDDVKGIRGVGEATAAKFVRGSLNHKYKSYTNIMNNLSICNRNIALVKLPFPDVNKFRLQRDKVTKKKWREVARSLDMKSLLHLAPLGAK